MASDFYCEEVLSGCTVVKVVAETSQVLAFHHTRPAYPVHIVVIPKRHIASLLATDENDNDLLMEMLTVIRKIATQITEEHQGCRVITNLGQYQDSKHLHWHIVSGQAFQ